jgi:hypothetical protein
MVLHNIFKSDYFGISTCCMLFLMGKTGPLKNLHYVMKKAVAMVQFSNPPIVKLRTA